jgi:flagellar basal-body rod protein FlgC
MDIIKAMRLSAAGLKAEGFRMRIVAENLANAENQTSGANGEPYKRKLVTLKNVLDRSIGLKKIAVDKVQTDKTGFERKYDPGNPTADAQGYVQMPNVKPMIELMDMKQAQRSYEANLNVIQAAKSMLQKTIDLLRA